MQICGKRYKKLETGRNHSGAASQRKKRMRGFNQAADLAERIGKILGIPVAEDVIYKSRETRSQKKLDAEERKKNLRNAFQAAGPVTG